MGSLFPIVETVFGQVQGRADGPIVEFRGIPYGAPTGGRNRFMPPRKPAAWTGVRECFAHGPLCPQVPLPNWDFRTEYFQLILWDCQPGGMSEDCLNLNLWTPGVNDGAKRPVLVLFHGGNFDRGSGNAPGYDGKNLALFGDAVVVTVNHRLASLGYLCLEDLGAPPEFAASGVAGLLDLVAALEWIRDNIDQFGGDASRVTIFGQSGGGEKVAALLAMPCARGLFHRAAIQSAGSVGLSSREEATRSAAALLNRLGITATQFRRLQDVPWQSLLQAQLHVPATQFVPVVGGPWLPQHPFDSTQLTPNPGVPLILSSTLEDAAIFDMNFKLTEAAVRTELELEFAGSASAILAMYREIHPQKSPHLIKAQIASDRRYRRPVLQQAEHAATRWQIPVYVYLWTWPSPAHDGKFGAVHFVDVPASMHNARDPVIGAGSAMAIHMCRRMASAWITFAREGVPRLESGESWVPYETSRPATMVIGDEMRVENDPRSDIRRFWDTASLTFSL